MMFLLKVRHVSLTYCVAYWLATAVMLAFILVFITVRPDAFLLQRNRITKLRS